MAAAMDFALVLGVLFGLTVAVRGIAALEGIRLGSRFLAILDYLIAAFIVSLMPLAIAGLLGLPLLAYDHYAHSDTGTRLFSMLLDRPFFPLQTVVAALVRYLPG